MIKPPVNYKTCLIFMLDWEKLIKVQGVYGKEKYPGLGNLVEYFY